MAYIFHDHAEFTGFCASFKILRDDSIMSLSISHLEGISILGYFDACHNTHWPLNPVPITPNLIGLLKTISLKSNFGKMAVPNPATVKVWMIFFVSFFLRLNRI